MDEGLGGRSVLVFGASGALGSGVAAAFAAAGAVVTGTDIAVPDGGAAVDSVSYAAADVTDDDELRALFDRRPAPWAVINTVGGVAPRRPLAELGAAGPSPQLGLH